MPQNVHSCLLTCIEGLQLLQNHDIFAIYPDHMKSSYIKLRNIDSSYK